MCEDTHDTGRNIIFTSVTQLASGRRHCDVNDGRKHWHYVKAENRRRETALVLGTVKTHSSQKQLDFIKGRATSPTWDVDFQALGQQESSDNAEIRVRTPHSSSEDIIADLTYEFDDALSSEQDGAKLTIRVNL